MSTLFSFLRLGQGPHPQSLSRRTIRLGCAALLTALLACGGDSTGPEPIEGTYVLQTMGGRSLPVVVLQDGSEKEEITAGSITLGTPNVFTMELTFRQTIGTQVYTLTSDADGAWSRSGAIVTMTVDGESVTATLSGRTLTISEPVEDLGTVEWVFRRQ